jgi:hypothetical protein
MATDDTGRAGYEDRRSCHDGVCSTHGALPDAQRSSNSRLSRAVSMGCQNPSCL